MKSVYLKRLTLVITAFTMTFGVMAQTVNQNYQDGKIWFKIKDNYPAEEFVGTKAGAKADPLNLPFGRVSYLKGIVRDFQVTALKKPFHAAKNSGILQRTYQLEFSDHSSVDLIVERLANMAMIEYAEKVPYDQVDFVPNDPSYNPNTTMWYLGQINAEQAWNYTLGSSNIIVATVDNAVETAHPDLNPALWVNGPESTGTPGVDDDGNGYVDDVNGYDVADGDANTTPPTAAWDHGTHVAGTTGAATNNSTGVASIGAGVAVMAVKATTNSANPSAVTDGYAGITYAAASGAHVINCSWGGTSFSASAQNVVNWAYGQGSIIVAAAGNSNTSGAHYPSAYNNVISVAATTNGDFKAGFSNYDASVDICAPGTAIYSTVPFGNYSNMQGTSMASPVVAGLAGLIYSLNPAMTQADVENCITSTAVNIDGINPTYAGQLGAGRIDANAAMACAGATLNNPPTADFVGAPLNIVETAWVTFTDLSVYSPTSWSWTFTGGSPASFNGQTPPPIQYNTAGTYDVSLTVTNANGNDTKTNVGYVVVATNTGCDTIGGQDPFNVVNGAFVYGAGAGGVDGYVAGCNAYGDRAKAEYIDATPYTYMTGCWMWIGRGYSSNGNEQVDVNVWDATGGTPGGAPLHTETITMNDIMFDVTNNFITYVPFSTPLLLPASKEIGVGIDVQNLNWAIDKDSLCIVTTQASVGPATGYEQDNTGTWNNYSVGWGSTWSHYIEGFFTDIPPISVAGATSATTICEGESVNFDGAGSNPSDTLLWTFLGGTPIQSNNMAETVFYSTAGTYWAYLEILGGACADYAVDSIQVTVNALPNVTVNAGQDTICPAGSTVITASGASSYLWTPAAGLSCTTCPNPTASPASTTTYTVTGTTAGCDRVINYTIYVDVPPVADMLQSADTICVGSTVNYNGNLSQNAVGWSWTLAGGTPGTSSQSSPTITYNTAGTYNVDLTVNNSCAQTDNTSSTIVVEAAPTVSAVPTATTICEGQTVTFDGSGSTATSAYAWTFAGGSPATSTTSTQIVSYATAGSYSYDLIVTGQCGTDNTSGTITVNPNPVAAFTTSADTVCENTTINFDASTSVGTSYSWSFTGGSPATSTAVNPAILYATAGSQPYTLTVTNSCGTDIINGTIVVNAATPTASYTASTTTICEGQSITFDGSGSTNASSTSWTFTGGSPATGSNAMETVTYSTVGNYTVQLIVDNTCSGLSDTMTTSITVDPAPIAMATISTDTICEGDSIVFDGSGSSGTGWAWTFTGGSIASGTNQSETVSYATQGSYTYELVVTNTCVNLGDTVTGSVVVENCVGIDESSSLAAITAYYARSNENVMITFNTPVGEAVQLSVVNSLGQQVKSARKAIYAQGQQVQLNVSELATGVYFLKVQGESTRHSIKFVKM